MTCGDRLQNYPISWRRLGARGIIRKVITDLWVILRNRFRGMSRESNFLIGMNMMLKFNVLKILISLWIGINH